MLDNVPDTVKEDLLDAAENKIVNEKGEKFLKLDPDRKMDKKTRDTLSNLRKSNNFILTLGNIIKEWDTVNDMPIGFNYLSEKLTAACAILYGILPEDMIKDILIVTCGGSGTKGGLTMLQDKFVMITHESHTAYNLTGDSTDLAVAEA